MTQRKVHTLIFCAAIFLCLCLSGGASFVFAIGGENYVEFTSKPDSARIVSAGIAAPVYVDLGDHRGVLRAANDLRADIARVTKIGPTLETKTYATSADIVLVGTVGANRRIDQLIENGKLDAGPIKGRWESYLIQVVPDPFPGVKRALVIAGSDKRGTIFGIYDLSEKIGVSPWYWWADVPAKQHKELFIRAGRYASGEPKVKYRGIFINDEAPALSGWSKEKFGGFNHKFYEKVFELILRMKGNFLWPAMWGNAFYDDDKENAKIADEYGIVIGTSHHEPMQRAHDEWRRYGKDGAWDYTRNDAQLRRFWTEGVRRAKGTESLITLGMRGDGDSPMSREANTALLEKIVADQRKIIAENINPDVTKVPQVWALYKEVQEYYEKGMRVPDDVTLLWCDDNWGNIRRLPTAEERSRAGGAGVYYHFDYVGGPRNYKWLNTIPITKIWEQMNLAYRYDANRIWIVNVGDIKPMEFPIQFFLDMAWDPEKIRHDKLAEYTTVWAEREFGKEHSAEIADIVSRYTKYNGRRKPELLEPATYSLVNYREAETIVDDYNKLAARAERIYKLLSPDKKDAFYQLVLYPVKACANINEMYVTVGKNRLYAVQGRASANKMADKARRLFRNDATLSRYYNETLAGGKWSHMMDQTRIGYTYWQQPVRNAMPGVQEIQIPVKSEMGIAVEGWEQALPEFPRAAVMPAQNIFQKQPRYFEIFNRGGTPFKFTVETKEPWLKVSQKSGTLIDDLRIWVSVDWNAVPKGETNGTVVISGPDERKITLTVPVSRRDSPKPGEIGFVENDGYVSIEAEHFNFAGSSGNRKWEVLPDFGRTLSAMAFLPRIAVEGPIPDDPPMLEYKMYLYNAGDVSVDAIFAPTQNFTATEGLRYAISFDDEKPQYINFHAGYTQAEWERSVRDGVRVVTSKHKINGPGWHSLKFWMVDPVLVIEKFVVNTGGLKPSYLGPPESHFTGNR